MKKLTEELEDTRNRGTRKTLIFKNIPQNKKEYWEETKSILAKELRKFMPQYQLEYVISKIESYKSPCNYCQIQQLEHQGNDQK